MQIVDRIRHSFRTFDLERGNRPAGRSDVGGALENAAQSGLYATNAFVAGTPLAAVTGSLTAGAGCVRVLTGVVQLMRDPSTAFTSEPWRKMGSGAAAVLAGLSAPVPVLGHAVNGFLALQNGVDTFNAAFPATYGELQLQVSEDTAHVLSEAVRLAKVTTDDVVEPALKHVIDHVEDASAKSILEAADVIEASLPQGYLMGLKAEHKAFVASIRALVQLRADATPPPPKDPSEQPPMAVPVG